MHVIAAKAVAFGEALQPSFRTYIEAVMANAVAIGEVLTERGFSLVSGGTDNHLLLVDLGEACSGKEAEEALGHAGITVNKNTVPGEKRSPFVTSGIRIGTPAVTTRGLSVDDARQVGVWIAEAIRQRDDAEALKAIRGQVRELCGRHPVYPERLIRP
jgi:glycine hydroxymethyltransferase